MNASYNYSDRSEAIRTIRKLLHERKGDSLSFETQYRENRYRLDPTGFWKNDEYSLYENVSFDIIENIINDILMPIRKQKSGTTKNRIVFLNTSILTARGIFRYTLISETPVEKWGVHEMMALQCIGIDTHRPENIDVLSAVGHQATVDIINQDFSRFGFPKIELNRISYVQEADDICIVLKMRGRPVEKKILDIEEMKRIGYDYMILKKIKE